MTIVKKKDPQILIKWSIVLAKLMNVWLKWKICHQNCLQFQRKKPGSSTRSDWGNFYDEANILGRARKATGKNKHWINIKGSDKYLKSLDLEQVEDLHELEENIHLTAVDTNYVNIWQAMLAELENWKHLDVYSQVEDNGQVYVTLAQGGLSRKWQRHYL